MSSPANRDSVRHAKRLLPGSLALRSHACPTNRDSDRYTEDRLDAPCGGSRERSKSTADNAGLQVCLVRAEVVCYARLTTGGLRRGCPLAAHDRRSPARSCSIRPRPCRIPSPQNMTLAGAGCVWYPVASFGDLPSQASGRPPACRALLPVACSRSLLLCRHSHHCRLLRAGRRKQVSWGG